jgi:hypothetical protein
VFDLAVLAHNGALAIAFDAFGRHAHRVDQLLRHRHAKRLEVIHERLNVLNIASGIGVLDHLDDETAPVRLAGHGTAFVENVLHADQRLSDLHLRHARRLLR